MNKTILVIKPDEMGDVLLLIPFLKVLRKQRPDDKIILAVNSKIKPLLKSNPYINNIINLNITSHCFTLKERVYAFYFSLLWFLKNHLFFCGEVYMMRAQPGFADKTLVQVSMGRVRTGWRNAGWPGLYTRPLDFQKGLHEAEQFMCALPIAVSDLPTCHFPCNEEAFLAADKMTSGGNRYLAIGANRTKDDRRNWPIENYAEFIRQIHTMDTAVQVILLGGPEDVSANNEIIRLTGDYVMSIAGKASLMESYAVLHRCFLFVGNDSGPMHLAAAAGVPVVEISYYPHGADASHSNAPERFGPVGVPFRVCRPSWRPLPHKGDIEISEECGIRYVSVAEVFDAYLTLCKSTGNLHV